MYNLLTPKISYKPFFFSNMFWLALNTGLEVNFQVLSHLKNFQKKLCETKGLSFKSMQSSA